LRSGTRNATTSNTASAIPIPIISAAVDPPLDRNARTAKIARIHTSDAGTSTFQPNRMNWS
jgi:hypothetical protein